MASAAFASSGAPLTAACLRVTGSVINIIGGWVPGVAFVGGAVKLAGKLLDPPAQLSDLRNNP